MKMLAVTVLHPGHTDKAGYGNRTGKGHPAWFGLAQLQAVMYPVLQPSEKTAENISTPTAKPTYSAGFLTLSRPPQA